MKNKTIPKFLMGLALSASLIGGAGAGVQAATQLTTNLTVNGSAREYAAYRIFHISAELKGDCSHGSNGHNVNCYSFDYTGNASCTSEAKQAAYSLYPLLDKDGNGSLSDKELLNGLSDFNQSQMRLFADKLWEQIQSKSPDVTTSTGTFSDIPMGYYLIAESEMAEGEDSRSLVMVDTAGLEDITIGAKEGVPSVSTKIVHEQGGGIVMADGYDVYKEDSIKYTTEIRLPENIASQRNFQMTLHNDGTHVDLSDVHLYVNGREVVFADGSDMSASDGCDLHVPIKIGAVVHCNCGQIFFHDEAAEAAHARNHIKLGEFDNTWTEIGSNLRYKDADPQDPSVSFTKDSIISVKYRGILTDDFVMGTEGNPLTTKLTYSNDPYGSTTADTPADIVKIFTYGLQVDKVDGSHEALPGADFTLYRKAGDSWEEVAYEETGSSDPTSFCFVGLDAGDYRLSETTAPDGYRKADDIFFTIESTYDETEDNPSLTGLSVLIDGEVVSSGDHAKFSVDLPGGMVRTEVVNTSAIKLPGTGSLDMMLLYLGSGILILGGGAAVFASRKKKIS